MKTKSSAVCLQLCLWASVLALSVLPAGAQSLAEAFNSPGLGFTNTQIGQWTVQTSVTHDGQAALQADSFTGESSLQTMVTGPGVATFWWKAASQGRNTYLYFSANFSSRDGRHISGDQDWQLETVYLPTGNVVLTWECYLGNTNSAPPGLAGGFLDQFTFTPGSVVAPSISTQPKNQTAAEGTIVQLSVGVAGTPPYSYLWLSNGVPMTNATQSSLLLNGVSSGTPAAYSVVVSNDVGYITSSEAVVTVIPAVPLATALETTNFTWFTSTNYAWVGQTNVSHDGVDAAQTGYAGDYVPGSMSVALRGSGTLSFWWKNNGLFDFSLSITNLAGQTVQQVWSSDSYFDWTKVSVRIPSEDCVATWSYYYMQQGMNEGAPPAAWVDQVSFVADAPEIQITLQPKDATNYVGQALQTFTAEVTGAGPMWLQWYYVGGSAPAPIGYGTATSLSLSNLVDTSCAGGYFLVASNSYGMVTSRVANLTMFYPIPLADATDNSYYWSYSYSNPWFGQTNVSSDGVDAAQSPSLPNGWGVPMWLNVTGPGTLYWVWKISGDADDSMTVTMDSAYWTPLAAVSGQSGWQTNSLAIPSGSHSIYWYFNRGSGAGDTHVGWVDQVTFGTAPSIYSQSANQSPFDTGEASLYVDAGGTAPLYYQWYCQGVPLAGENNYYFYRYPVDLTNAGTYYAVVTNAYGSVTSAPIVLKVIHEISLAEALDSTNVWANYNSSYAWRGQTEISSDGKGAAQSPAANFYNAQAVMYSQFVGPGTVKWVWKMSGGIDDFLYMNMDAVYSFSLAATIYGETGWTTNTYHIPSGAHTLYWVYNRDYSAGNGINVGWVDQVSFQPDPPALPVIVSQPQSLTLPPTASAAFYVTAQGTEPLSYQWYWNGVPQAQQIYSGLSTTANDSSAGDYYVVVSNALGMATSAVAKLSLIYTVPLADAVDSPNNYFTTDYSWFGQTNVTADGVDAAQSWPITSGNASTFYTYFTGPGTVTWAWKLSGDQFDSLLALLDHSYQVNSNLLAFTNGATGWITNSARVPAGEHFVYWSYTHGYGSSDGTHAAWVDQVTFTPASGPPTFETQPRSQTVFLDDSVSLPTEVWGTFPIDYRWYFNGSWLPSQTSSTLSLANLTANESGAYYLVASNAVGVTTSAVAQVTVKPYPTTLGEPLNTPDLTWITGGYSSWFAQTTNTHDGDMALRSGLIPGPTSSGIFYTNWIETTVTGPGTVSFWWRVSSEPGYDYLRFFIGGALQEQISGEVAWTNRTFSVPAGTQVLRFQYSKDYYISGADAGFVDQVVFTPAGGGAPSISLNPTPMVTLLFSGTLNLSAAASGGEPITWQWYFGGFDFTNAIPNATNRTLAITNVNLSHGGYYWAVASNSVGTAKSASSAVLVIPRPWVHRAPIITNNQCIVRFFTQQGASYTLQFSPSLKSPSWADLETFTGDNTFKYRTNSMDPYLNGYYRLKMH